MTRSNDVRGSNPNPQTKAARIKRRKVKSKRLQLEHLESRLLLAADFDAHPLFAPGTPEEYVEQFHHDHEDEHGHDHEDEFAIARFQFGDGDRFSTTTQNGSGLGQGDPTTVTWSIVPDGTNIDGFIGEPTSPSNLVSQMRGFYGIANNPGDTNYSDEAWFIAIEKSFDRWSEISGLNYVFEPNDDGANFAYSSGSSGVRGDVRVGGHTIDGNGGTLAYNFFPNTSDMVIDTADSFYGVTSNDSLRLRNVITHEAGHGVGISHVESNNASFLMEPFINLSFDGPQFDDILAAQRGYGDALEPNDTVGSAVSLGVISDGGSVSIGGDAVDLVISPGDTDFVSIDDNSDVDFFSFTVTGGSTLDATLTPLGPTYNQGPQGGAQAPFNASAQSDLTLQILDDDGSTVLATANGAGLGGTEFVSGVALNTGGTYFARVSGANNSPQMYQLSLAVEDSTPTPGVSIVASGGATEVSEDGATDTYTIVLQTQPTNDVTITITTDAQTTTSPQTVTFDATNWFQAQTVTVSAVDDQDIEGSHSSTIGHSASSNDSAYDGISIASVEVSITDNDESSEPSQDFYFSLASQTTIGEILIQDEDIVAWNGNETSIIFDGSDVGLAGMRIDAFDIISENEILLSFDTASGNVDDSDVLLFMSTATSLGEDTAGNFFFYFDGSDVGLTRNGEDVDGVTLLDDGTLLLSTNGTGRVSGLTFRDEDVVRFRPTSLGSATGGVFEEFIDGSDANIALNTSGGEDIDGVAVDGSGVYLTTVGNFSVPGVAGADDDVFVYDTQTGAFESDLYLNLSSNDLKGLDFPGTGSASALGLVGGNTLVNPYLSFEWEEPEFGRRRFRAARAERFASVVGGSVAEIDLTGNAASSSSNTATNSDAANDQHTVRRAFNAFLTYRPGARVVAQRSALVWARVLESAQDRSERVASAVDDWFASLESRLVDRFFGQS